MDRKLKRSSELREQQQAQKNIEKIQRARRNAERLERIANIHRMPSHDTTIPRGTIIETPAAVTVNTQTCVVCTEERDPVEYPLAADLPEPCRAHCQTICQSCLTASLTTDIANKALDRIGCPACERTWDRKFIELHAKAESLEFYYSRELLRLLEEMPEFRACQSPTCHSGQLHASGSAEPIVTCNDCGFRSCYNHRMPWHEGMTCLEYDRPGETDEERRVRLALEARAYEERYGRGSKPCPKCNATIIKRGGCDDMRCKLYTITVLLSNMLNLARYKMLS